MPKLNLSDINDASGSGYPSPFNLPCQPRQWKRIGEAAGLTKMGVNLVTLPPGCWSSQRHYHTLEDEFLIVLSGECIMIDNGGETLLMPGDMCAYPAGEENGHHLINRSEQNTVFLVCSNRDDEDVCEYPDIDMRAPAAPYGMPGGYTRKDGTPYPPKP